MGWPQEIEFRLDGGLMGRFTAGGEAGAYRPAPGTYEGAGSPGFEGDWEWEAYMQGAADDHLQVRTFITADPTSSEWHSPCTCGSWKIFSHNRRCGSGGRR